MNAVKTDEYYDYRPLEWDCCLFLYKKKPQQPGFYNAIIFLFLGSVIFLLLIFSF